MGIKYRHSFWGYPLVGGTVMKDTGLTRRLFLGGRILGSQSRGDPSAPRPPWAREAEAFAHLCDGRGECVAACPLGLLSPDETGRPVIDFVRDGCDFCGDCVRACPSGALDGAARDRGRVPWELKAVVGDLCLTRSGVMCRTCQDACPSHAIAFSMKVGAVAAPRIETDACSGCGACVAPCPVGALTVHASEA